jgi:hypothetical protein
VTRPDLAASGCVLELRPCHLLALTDALGWSILRCRSSVKGRARVEIIVSRVIPSAAGAPRPKDEGLAF